MNIGDCFQLGYISKVHGLQGEVAAVLDVDEPEKYEELESVFVEIDKQLVPFFIESISIRHNKVIIAFEEVLTAEKAEEFKGCKLFLPLTFLESLEKDQYYFHELLGFTVVEKEGKPLGTITQLYNTPGNDMVGVDNNGKEILVPLQNGIVQQVDKVKKELVVVLPEGLLDLYLNEDED